MPVRFHCIGVFSLFLIQFYCGIPLICIAFRPLTTVLPLRFGYQRPTASDSPETCPYVYETGPSASRSIYSFWSSIGSRTSIETVIHTGDCEDYDVNCVQYRKARYWRELSTPELEEEIRKVRKVLAKINLYRETKNPALHPSSLGNTRRTLAQLLFIRHERHLASLREKEDLKKLRAKSSDSNAAGDVDKKNNPS